MDEAPFDASNATSLTKIRHNLGAPDRLDQTTIVWTKQNKNRLDQTMGPNDLEQ